MNVSAPATRAMPRGTYWDPTRRRHVEPSDLDWTPDSYEQYTGERLTEAQALDLILAAE